MYWKWFNGNTFPVFSYRKSSKKDALSVLLSLGVLLMKANIIALLATTLQK